MTSKLIKFTPSEGVIVINPDTNSPIDSSGEVVTDSIYYQRRVMDGSGTISEPTKKSK